MKAFPPNRRRMAHVTNVGYNEDAVVGGCLEHAERHPFAVGREHQAVVSREQVAQLVVLDAASERHAGFKPQI